MKNVFLIAACAALASCGEPIDWGEVVDVSVERATITGVNHPKHFSVDIKTQSGLKFHGIARSKHCTNSRSRVFVGQEYNVVLIHRRYQDGKITMEVDGDVLNNMLCK